MTDRAAWIAKLRALPGQLRTLTEGLSAEQLTAHYMSGEWSVAQNVHHLADAHINAYVRSKLIVAEDRPALKVWDQEAWAEHADSAAADVELSLQLISGLHQRWAIFWESLSDADLARVGIHPVNGEMTAERILSFYSGHGEAHLDQIQRTLAAGGIERKVI